MLVLLLFLFFFFEQWVLIVDYLGYLSFGKFCYGRDFAGIISLLVCFKKST